MNLNLIMAFVWLLGAAGLFVWNAQNPDRALVIRRTDVSLGWFALVIGAYNLVRWWSRRAAAREERAERSRRRPPEEEEIRRGYQEPDPNFDFSRREDEPPKAGPI